MVRNSGVCISFIWNSKRFHVSIGGSVVEFSPATREARVWFPANASAFLSLKLALLSKVVIYDIQVARKHELGLNPDKSFAPSLIAF